MKVVLAGGTGSLGRVLADDFAARGAEVVVLTRAPRDGGRHRQVVWDGRDDGCWGSELEGATVVNLAGELVDCRPTARNIARLTSSRVGPTQALVRASQRCRTPPRCWLQMSTLAIYGDGGPGVIEEGAPPADGPPQMAGVATAWEQALDGAVADRVVVMRTGLVLAPHTPAFDRLTHLTRVGLGGRIASGEQWVSWLHVDDFLAAVRYLGTDSAPDGNVHVTSPEPIQNRQMMAALRRQCHRPPAPPTPRPLAHAGAWCMRTDPALALLGRRCVPRRLLDAGFEFTHPQFDEALAELLDRD